MENRVANPNGLGFAAWAIGAWMYSMVPAGWFPLEQLESSTMRGVATFAMLALLIAALASFLRGNAWHGVFFMFWSAIWWGYQGTGGGGNEVFVGWYFLAIAVVSFFLWWAALRSGLSLPVNLLSLGLWIAFALWALGYWFGLDVLALIGGYVGLLSALAAFWATAVEMLGGGAPARQSSGAPMAGASAD